MVETKTMRTVEEEDSLDVFTHQYAEDIFLDSLEPSTIKERTDVLVGNQQYTKQYRI